MVTVRTSPSLDALVPSWSRHLRAANAPHHPVLRGGGKTLGRVPRPARHAHRGRLLHPFAVRCRPVGGVDDEVALDVDPGPAVRVEGVPQGRAVTVGVVGGHLGRLMPEHFLHDVLGDPLVDHPSAQGVAELMTGQADRGAGIGPENAALRRSGGARRA